MELLNHPSNSKPPNPQFAGRDWRQIRVGELVSRDDVRIVDSDILVEDATKLLVESGSPNVILIRDANKAVSNTFDFNDLLCYLLVVLGKATPNEDEIEAFTEIAKKAAEGAKIKLNDIEILLARKEPLVTLTDDQSLSKATQHFGSGVHRVIVLKDDEICGILSQLKLVKFLWENVRCFPGLEQLYPMTLRELEIGSRQIVSINGDEPLIDALLLMNSEALTSVAVVDAACNVIGNISNVDVKLLTNTRSLPLLKSSCIHFISVILNERGVEDGQDSYPVFYVNNTQSLSQVVSKVVATSAHRLWVVDAASPSTSTPMTPLMTPTGPVEGSYPSASATFLQSTPISGRLSGVISLTDILNCFGRHSGLLVADPSEQRERRRRSSSSSVRPSMDSVRRSMDIRR